MKKKLIITNGFIVLGAMILLLIASIFIVSHFNEKNSASTLQNYLKMTALLYDGTNEATVITEMQVVDSNIRLTFIGYDGEVLADSYGNAPFESHLDRPEILDLGTVYKRYSDTFDQNMIYVAMRDEGIYLRAAMPIHSINALVSNFILFASILFVLVFVISFFVIEEKSKKLLIPLNQVVKKLSRIVPDSSYVKSDDIDMLSSQIDDINQLIHKKIQEITDEKDKVHFIINNMNQGIVVLDNQMNIILLNEVAATIFDEQEPRMIGKNYLYLIRDIEFQEKITKAITDNEHFHFDYASESKIFFTSIFPIQNHWVQNQTQLSGAVILLLDVTERRNVETMKKEFFANASHELKSPLTSIIGYQEMIQVGLLQQREEIQDAVTRTLKEANRMNQIIKDMLEISNLEGKKENRREDIWLNSLVKEIIESHTQILQEKDIQINLELQPFQLSYNSEHLFQLINNLVDNAIKYNIEHGKIFISIHPKEKEFVISDTGIGIPKEDQTRVFERFYRVDKGRSKETGGTGLGLSIVKHICQLYQTSITLQSEIQKGTTIKLRFK